MEIHEKEGVTMAIEKEAPPVILETTMAGEVQRHWGWVLAIGIIFVVLGFFGLGMTFAVTMASMLMYGILMLLGAGAQFVQAAKGRGWKGIIFHVLIALLYLVAGIAVIVNPVGASMVLTLLLAAALIVVGFVRIVMAFQLRGFRNWFWPLAGGVHHPGRDHCRELANFRPLGDWPFCFDRIDSKRLVLHFYCLGGQEAVSAEGMVPGTLLEARSDPRNFDGPLVSL
jgi:uncharacterized membrane protein HdeD (DUF308 family)